MHSVLVILDTDHISIPKPNEVEYKVRFLLSENGYHGSVSTRAFYSDKNHFSDELANEYCTSLLIYHARG